MRGHQDLRLVVAATAVCALVGQIAPLGVSRIVFVAPLALLLPGYAITAAAFGKRRPEWLDLVPLSVGISLAALALGSVFLNFTPGGLTGIPWTVFLVLVVVGSCRAAALRRGAPTRRRSAIAMPKVRPAGTILSVGAVAMAAAALILAQTTVHANRAIGYSELWMVPADQSSSVAQIGVTSEQQHALSYRLEVRFGDRPAPIIRSFSLAPGESRTVRLAHPPSTEPTRIKAKLFTQRDPEAVSRQVFGWLPAGTSQ